MGENNLYRRNKKALHNLNQELPKFMYAFFLISWWWREQACKLCYFGALKIVNFPSDTGVGHMVYMQFSSFGDWVATLFSFVFGLYVHLLVYAVIVPTLPHPLVGREVSLFSFSSVSFGQAVVHFNKPLSVSNSLCLCVFILNIKTRRLNFSNICFRGKLSSQWPLAECIMLFLVKGTQ